MMHHNRWFLDDPIDLDRLERLLGQLIAPNEVIVGIAGSWYRSRLLSGDAPFPIDEMGPPLQAVQGTEGQIPREFLICI